LIRRVACADNTLLIVEHDMSVLFGLADKIAVMSAGELLAFDHPSGGARECSGAAGLSWSVLTHPRTGR
jgi:ABC-type branched-subunit amino acid transport system ATPase component